MSDLKWLEKLNVDTPAVEHADGNACIEWVEIIDPREPLFGRRFEVLKVTRNRHENAQVLVQLGGFRIRVPLHATNLSALSYDRVLVRLTHNSVKTLLSLVKEYELCQHPREESGRRSPKKRSDSSPQQSCKS